MRQGGVSLWFPTCEVDGNIVPTPAAAMVRILGFGIIVTLRRIHRVNDSAFRSSQECGLKTANSS